MAPRTSLDTATRFRADMERLKRCIAGLSQQQHQSAMYDGWTAKEMLAHIAAWDRELVRGLDELLAGRRPAFAGYSEAQFNARVVEASRATPFADVLAELGEAHETLVGRIEALTDEEWRQSSPLRWGNGTLMTVASLFDYTYKGKTHYGGHAREIEEWAQRSEV